MFGDSRRPIHSNLKNLKNHRLQLLGPKSLAENDLFFNNLPEDFWQQEAFGALPYSKMDPMSIHCGPFQNSRSEEESIANCYAPMPNAEWATKSAVGDGAELFAHCAPWNSCLWRARVPSKTLFSLAQPLLPLEFHKVHVRYRLLALVLSLSVRLCTICLSGTFVN